MNMIIIWKGPTGRALTACFEKGEHEYTLKKKENQNELSIFIKAEENILWAHTFSNILFGVFLATLMETEQANVSVCGFCDKNALIPLY